MEKYAGILVGALMRAKRIVFILILMFFSGCVLNAASENTMDLTLEDCVEIALSRNADVIKAAEDIKKSRKYLLEHFSDFLPIVYLGYNFLKASDTGARHIANEDFLYAESAAGLHIDKEVFKGGEYYYGYRKARLGVEKAKESYLGVSDRVTFQVKNAYYDMLLVDKLLSLNIEEKKRMEAYLSKVMKKGIGGDVRKYEILRSKIEVQNLQSNLMSLGKEKIAFAAKLKKLLMLEDNREISVRGLLSGAGTESGEYASLDSLLAVAENRNRDIRVAEISSEMGKETINIISSKYSPTAAIQSAFYRSSDEFNLNSHYFYDWSFMVKIKMPVFDGFKTSALVSQSRSEYANLETSEEAVKNAVSWEVKEAVSNLAKTKKLIKHQRGLATDTRDAMNIAWVLYNRGEASQWDTIDAHLNYMEAESDLFRFMKDYSVLVAKIEYLISRE